jgi:phosphoribosylformylglycinamidine synthase
MEFSMSAELKAKLKTYRLSESEYQKIGQLLGRPPQGVEWALFSALWSEHCSYKSSRVHLKKFGKTLTEAVVTSQGENAGVLDLGYDEKVVFKMESHNHPSFIEPYQGAATGVGGILRDVFTMGARPVALADYLCFGEPQAPRMKSLVDGVVRGISGYGNCVGVPTITGQTNFDPAYNNNILVNAMAVGLILSGDEIALSGAKGPGNLVVYVGAKTGRDGVHGAAMASESFDEDSDAKKPNVQIGDPYFEKLLIESCLEVIRQKLVVAIQDMGAAGLTSSSFEMAAKGGVGMKLDLSKVPLRDSSMGPEEILLSESQERMLLVCEPAKFQTIQKVFERWGLDASVVGEVTADRKVSLWWRGECLTAIDPSLLTDNAPMYERPYSAWSSPRKKENLSALEKMPSMDLAAEMKKPQHCARKWIYRQYDQRVGARTARGAEHDVAIHRLPSGRGLAVTVGCRPAWMKRDARIGALDAIFYPSLQMAIKGAEVQGVTDCLNFGNPEKPEIMSEFVASVEAIAQASEKLRAPVISGNVSFYNETLGKNIISTPATGLVGIRPDVENIPEDTFQEAGSEVYLLRWNQARSRSGLSEWVGDLSVDATATLIKDLVPFFQDSSVLSSQVVSGGGLLLSLAKMSLGGTSVFVDANLSLEEMVDEVLYEVIVELKKGTAANWIEKIEHTGVRVLRLGSAQAGELRWKNHSWKVSELKASSEAGFGGILEELA